MGNGNVQKTEYFTFPNQYDDRKWAVAAAACERVMDMGLYELHTVPADKDSYIPPTNENQTFPNGVGGIDPFKLIVICSTVKSDGRKNKEYIWGKNCQKYYAPGIFSAINGWI